MVKKQITETIMKVARGDLSIDEGAKSLRMSVVDFERMMNAWEDAQQAWDRMLQITIISELKNGKSAEEIVEALNCCKPEVERAKKRWKQICEVFEEVKEGNRAPGCGACIARVYIGEMLRMMEQEVENQ